MVRPSYPYSIHLFSSLMNSSVALLTARVLVACLIVNLFNKLIDYNRVLILSIYICLGNSSGGHYSE
jgi:hypothetical protein